MTTAGSYPGDLSELGFLRAYLDSTLRKPQTVADAVLRTSVLAGQAERVLLTASLAEQLGEAARRLVHVFEALDDRTHPVARTLAGPLPGLARWAAFAQLAATLPAASLVQRMSLDASASDYAERLRSLGDFGFVTAAVAAHASGNPLLLVRDPGGHRPPDRFRYASTGSPEPDFELGTSETDAAALADLTADVCWIARGFLQTYLEARNGAGRRD